MTEPQVWVEASARPDKLVLISERVAAPSVVTVVARGFQGFDVYLKLVPRWGGLDLHSVAVSSEDDGAPVTGEVLRRIPIATLARESFKTLLYLRPTEDDECDGEVSWTGGWIPQQPLSPEIRACWPSRDLPVALRHVAMNYTLASAAGLPPTKEIELNFGVSRATAGRMISEARRRGFLGNEEPSDA